MAKAKATDKPAAFERTKTQPHEWQNVEIRVRHLDTIKEMHEAWPSYLYGEPRRGNPKGRYHAGPRDWLEAILDSVIDEWVAGVDRHVTALMKEHKRVPTPEEFRAAIEAART